MSQTSIFNSVKILYIYPSENGGGTCTTNQMIHEEIISNSETVDTTKPDTTYTLIDTDKMEAPSTYQHLTVNTTQKKLEDMKKGGVDKRGGLTNQEGKVTLDNPIYATCT